MLVGPRTESGIHFGIWLLGFRRVRWWFSSTNLYEIFVLCLGLVMCSWL